MQPCCTHNIWQAVMQFLPLIPLFFLGVQRFIVSAFNPFAAKKQIAQKTELSSAKANCCHSDVAVAISADS
jgi:hypothetical protein